MSVISLNPRINETCYQPSTIVMEMAVFLVCALLLLYQQVGVAARDDGALTEPLLGGQSKTLHQTVGKAVLSDLALTAGSLVPAFNESVYFYTASVNSSVTEVAVYVEVPTEQIFAGSGVNVNGTWVDSASFSPFLELGLPGYTTTIYVYVLAIGYSPSTYTVYVTREADDSGDDSTDSDSSGAGGLGTGYIVLIVIACVVAVALLAYALYWAFQRGWLDWIPGVSSAGRRTGDYQSMP